VFVFTVTALMTTGNKWYSDNVMETDGNITAHWWAKNTMILPGLYCHGSWYFLVVL